MTLKVITERVFNHAEDQKYREIYEEVSKKCDDVINALNEIKQQYSPANKLQVHNEDYSCLIDAYEVLESEYETLVFMLSQLAAITAGKMEELFDNEGKSLTDEINGILSLREVFMLQVMDEVTFFNFGTTEKIIINGDTAKDEEVRA